MFKVIIAEDDKFTRNGIIRLINRSNDIGFEIVGEAEDGSQALQLVRDKNPDVILTDINMPKLSGLELIQSVKEINPEVLMVIISGYDDFKYMQAAIQLGVKDYLLKPVLPDQIREILVSVKETIERQEKFLHNIEELKQQVKESLPIVRERFYNELITGKLAKEEICAKADYLKTDLTGELFTVAIIKIKNYIKVDDEDIRKEDLMQYFLFDVINKIYGSQIKVYAFAQTDYQVVLIFCVNGLNRNVAFIQINGRTTKLINSLQKYINVTAFAAIGRLYQDVCNIKNSFAEAKEALNYNFSMQDGSVINFEDICFSQQFSRKRPVEIDEKIILHTKLCEHKECVEQIRKLFEFYAANKIEDPHFIKIDVFELVMIVFCNTDYIFENSETVVNTDNKCRTYQEILQCETLSNLETWTLHFFESHIQKIEKERASRGYTVIEKVKEMVELYYKDSDFTLDDVASKLFISPNYLRQIFKQKTGEPFVEYLTKIRMEKSAQLLSDVTLKVQHISEKVGYDNQQYFAMCFKKYFGCTPSDYRKTQAKQ